MIKRGAEKKTGLRGVGLGRLASAGEVETFDLLGSARSWKIF